MNQERKNEIREELSNRVNGETAAYAGPVAEHIERLEGRIDNLYTCNQNRCNDIIATEKRIVELELQSKVRLDSIKNQVVDHRDLRARVKELEALNLKIYVGGVVDRIITLETEVESLKWALALERQTPAFRPPELIKVGNTVVDNRPGVQLSDIIELIREVKK